MAKIIKCSADRKVEKLSNISQLDKFRELLANAETLEEVVDIRSAAEGIRVFARSAALGLDMQNRAAEFRLRAERKAGMMLSQLSLRGGDHKSNGRRDRLKLSDLGITQNQSKRWQRESMVPDSTFDAYVKRATSLGEEVTAAGLLRTYRNDSNVKPRAYRNTSSASTSHEMALQCGKVSQRRSDEATLAELAEEGMRHYELLSHLLAPITTKPNVSLLPVQRKAIRRYLVEIGRIFGAISAALLDISG
jgi:hypothetical protein